MTLYEEGLIEGTEGHVLVVRFVIMLLYDVRE